MDDYSLQAFHIFKKCWNLVEENGHSVGICTVAIRHGQLVGFAASKKMSKKQMPLCAVAYQDGELRENLLAE